MTFQSRYNGITRVQAFFVMQKEPTEYDIKRLKAEKIIRYVFKKLNVDHRNFRIKLRKGEIVKARRTAIYLIFEYIDMSKLAIGGLFAMDHSTIIYHINTCEDLIFSDPKVKIMIEQAVADLGLKKPQKTVNKL